MAEDFDAMEVCCKTGHNYLAAHLNPIKIFSHNCCTICKWKNITMDKNHLLVCPKLDHTSKELSKLMECRKINGINP